jgi:DNA-binding LacI/PurR family transcriptional regulator
MAKSPIKHREIYEHVHGAILAGKYGVGDRIPTEAELSARFATSRVTVARALRDLEQQGWLERRRGAGSFVRRPQGSESKLLGLITGESAGIFPILCDEIARVAQSHGFGVMLGKWPIADIDRIVHYTQELSEQYIARRVAGVIFEPMYVPAEQMPVNARIAEAFANAGIPVVLLDRDIYDFPRRSEFDMVGIDNHQAGYALTEHLLSLGHLQIHFLSAPLAASTVTARKLGYRDALLRHGIEPDPGWVHYGNADDHDWVREIFRTAKPEAFVCSNDFEAARLMRALSTLDVRIPEDVAIVGVNDDPYAKLLTVSLTTLRQPYKQMAGAAVRLMLDRLQNRTATPREVRMSCELVVRESCGTSLRSRATVA